VSNTDGDRVSISGATLVWAIAAMFIAVVAAVVALSIGLPESQNPAGLVAQLLGSFAALVAVLGTLFSVRRVSAKMDQVVEDTAEIREQTNGQLDHRVRTLSYESMRQALVDHLDDDDVNPDSTDRPHTPGGDPLTRL
jgi:hypothetical protein